MDEILYELRDHASGLNAGRWDYLFSIIKYFRDAGPDFVLPDRGVGDDDRAVHARLHRAARRRPATARGAFAIGGMAAFIPSRARRRGQRARLRQGPRGQATRGRRRASTAPGSPTPTWSRSAQEIFDDVLGDRPNQLDRQRADVHVDRRASCSTSSSAARRGHRSRPAHATSRSRCATSQSWLQRQRRGRDPQPHGGRRHRRDLALADLAVGAQRASRSTTAASSPRTWSVRSSTTSWPDCLTEPNGARLADAGRLFAAGRPGRGIRRVPDLARLRPDRLIEFRGRRDTAPTSQAQRRGVRPDRPHAWRRSTLHGPPDIPASRALANRYTPSTSRPTSTRPAWPRRGDNWRRDALLQHAGTPESLTQIVRTSPDIGRAVFDRVLAKLAQQPIEDLRIDFEDGYGTAHGRRGG